MSLVARLEPLPEPVSEMEAAAEGRYQEGQKLVLDGYHHAGIYLLGYAAEIWLKTALCRVDPALLPTDTVDAHIGPARYRWRLVFGGRPPSGHDLLFLALSLEDERRLVGKPQLIRCLPSSAEPLMVLSACCTITGSLKCATGTRTPPSWKPRKC